MEGLLGSKSLPLGFRFHPTDEELFMFYLKRKVLGKSLGPQMMSEVDVYKFAPWDLPAMACLKTRDLNWYFFCPRAKKYPNGARANRATECGYWKSTGNDRTVKYSLRPVGKIKTLIFHRGKAPNGERTDWVMHEYRLEDSLLAEKGVAQDSYVICKIFEKSGLGPKNGENYGARFVEEEWDSDTEDGNLQQRGSGPVQDASVGSPVGSVSVLTSVGTPIAVGYPSTPVTSMGMGTPYAAASLMGTPYSIAAASNVSTIPNIPAAPLGIPCIPTTSVGTPYSTAAASNASYLSTTPNIPAAPLGIPCIPTTFVGMPSVALSSVGMPNLDTPNVDTASMSSVSAHPASVGTASGSENGSTEDELDRLLKPFTEDAEDDLDIYRQLGDLADHSVQNIDWDDCFIEMNDLD